MSENSRGSASRDIPPEYSAVTDRARRIFAEKHANYGASWLLLRPRSLTDQALIKATRIRKVTSTGVNLVGEAPIEDAIALYNYATMAIFALRTNPTGEWPNLVGRDEFIASQLEDIRLEAAALLAKKNHDYDNIWRQFRVDTIVDLILSKLFRIRSQEGASGPLPMDGLVNEWIDIANYSALMPRLFTEHS